MGCASSTAEGSEHVGTRAGGSGGASSASPGLSLPGASLSPYGPLSREQYTSRLVHSGSVRETRVQLAEGEGREGASYTLRWAYASQRGYYPDQPSKARARRVRAAAPVAS
jgi:hypothetical protein